MRNYVEVNELSKKYDDITALQNVTFCIAPREIFGLLGPSGSGKTTILNILTGQIPYEGKAEVLGTNCMCLSDREYKNLGIVLDNVGLYERLTCGENLKLFAKIHGVSVGKVDEVLENVNLQDDKNKRVNQLSKGMRQRLSLARAIMHQPKILFLDEPTSGLDPVTIKYIHSIITNMAQTGTAIVLATHNMEEAAKLCTNVGLLSRGKIVEYGAPSLLCQKYCKKKGHEIILENKERIVVSTFSDLINYINQSKILSIHTIETTLEDVFINLTGERLL